MAEDTNTDNQDRTEEATPERRDEFRERGHVAVSREVTSVFALVASVIFLSFYSKGILDSLIKLLTSHFQKASRFQISEENFLTYIIGVWTESLFIIVPLFIIVATISCLMTFAQTRFNWSWQRLAPDFKRLNIFSGLVQMVNGQSVVNLFKGIGKMLAVGLVSYLILYSEWIRMPGLMNLSISRAWYYWADITKLMLWATSALLLALAVGDYAYNFATLERKLRMTKQEVREDLKRREVDPHVRGKLRKMQRDIALSKIVSATKKATVVVTNPTHFAVALHYELGMPAPKVVAKGIDFNALRMREVAKECNVPVIENKPLARTLYKIVEVGQFVPESLYRAVSEVIRYVFKLKGKPLVRRSA